MKAVAGIQVIPIGIGVSLRAQVRRAKEIIQQSGLGVQEHSSCTNVEGDLEKILEVVPRLDEVLHAEGTPRLSTSVKLGTRSDRDRIPPRGCVEAEIGEKRAFRPGP